MFNRRLRSPSPIRPAAIQPLEGRRLLSGDVVASPLVTVTAAASSSTVVGLTPAQVKAAYGLTGLSFDGTAADGAGQTIAIVDAYDAPTLAADLATFSTTFGLPAASLSVVSQTGGSTLPATDAGWAQEISLDVEWAHAIAPAAKILLVEATTDSTTDLLAAVDYARGAAGVSVVSMSWGADEFNGETAYDTFFTTPTGHAGVTFVAAAGDDGSASGAMWPAAAAGVVSVGGTTLTLAADGTVASEVGWTSGGGGLSTYEGEPTYQRSAQTTGYRTTPDVAWNADPDTGVAVYDSTAYDGTSGWMEFGGTSAGAPQWAALVALADQGRALDGSAPLDGATNTLPTLYGLYAHTSTRSADFRDVTSGSTSRTVAAATGYDMVAGIGTPRAAALVERLVGSDVSVKLAQASVTVTNPNPGPPGHGRFGYAHLVEVDVTVLAPDPADGATARTVVDLAITDVTTAGPAAAAAAWATAAPFDTGGFDVPPAVTTTAVGSADWAASSVLPSLDAPTTDAGAAASNASATVVAFTAAAADPIPTPAPSPFADGTAIGRTTFATAAETGGLGVTPRGAGATAVAVGVAAAAWLVIEPARVAARERKGDTATTRLWVAAGPLRA